MVPGVVGVGTLQEADEKNEERDAPHLIQQSAEVRCVFDIDSTIRENRSIFVAAIIQLGYGLMELADSVAIVLITIGLIPNLYFPFLTGNAEIYAMLENMPVVFIPIFWCFTTLRLLSAFWILKNKIKGFWLAIFVSGITLIAAFFLLPFGAFDMLPTLPVVVLLFNGYFKERRILEEGDSAPVIEA
ncbi:MAG: hypothetical protein EAX95_11875 [Candidatus Thorarchaeota archaeon]|nr:hypothetical protein [Candidatus Thorarchaeota archaeon]